MIETAICIASGPSLTKDDIDYCRDKGKVYVVNDCHRLAPWANVLYACDFRWWEHHNGAAEFRGEKWTIDKAAAEKYQLNYIAAAAWHEVFIMDRQAIGLGSNSGFQVLNLAALRGAKRIILLGYDMKLSAEGKRHWFGEHPDALMLESDYKKWCANFAQAAPFIKHFGIEVINCSRDTALNCFPVKNLREVI